MRFVGGLILWMVGSCLAIPVHSQFIYLDANGDGLSTNADALSSDQVTTVSIWLLTDTGKDGSKAALGSDPTSFSINSYTLLLRAVGGTVEWGDYRNCQPSMKYHFGPTSTPSEYFTFYGGMEFLPPGKYKLGELSVRPISGSPEIVFASTSQAMKGAGTSFGSQRAGKDTDNTLKFTEQADAVGKAVRDVPGDWCGATGLGAPNKGTQSTQAAARLERSVFSVSVSPNPSNFHTGSASIRVTTTGHGLVRVRLFDVSGRLVRTLLDLESTPPGTYLVPAAGTQSGSLAAGVYMYRVETSERSVDGRLVVLK